MRNLKPQEKKLFSRLAIVFGIIIILGTLHFVGSWFYKHQMKKFLKEKNELIELYESKIDSLNTANKILLLKVDKLDGEVDSLQKVKTQIYEQNNEEINVIYDASSADHAKWMESILLELKADRKLNY